MDSSEPQHVAFLPVFGNDVAHGAPILYSATECRQGALCHGAIVKNVCAHEAIAVALVRLLELKASLHRNFHYAVKLLCFPHLFALGKLDNSLFISICCRPFSHGLHPFLVLEYHIPYPATECSV